MLCNFLGNWSSQTSSHLSLKHKLSTSHLCLKLINYCIQNVTACEQHHQSKLVSDSGPPSLTWGQLLNSVRPGLLQQWDEGKQCHPSQSSKPGAPLTHSLQRYLLLLFSITTESFIRNSSQPRGKLHLKIITDSTVLTHVAILPFLLQISWVNSKLYLSWLLNKWRVTITKPE